MEARIVVAYHSGFGKTGELADAVCRGAGSVPGADATLCDITALDEAGWTALDAADAIIFGAPTYFGSVSAEFKRFIEASASRWFDGPRWKDKLAGGFTNSKTMSGDKLNTLFDLAVFAAQHGMIWIGLDLYPGWHTSDGTPDELNRIGSWLGVMSQANSDEPPGVVPPRSDLDTGGRLGQRVAEYAVLLATARKASKAAAA